MKKKIVSTAAAIVAAAMCTAPASAFPEPDWAALLRERKAMVNAADLELYVEGDVESAPYYGAKFEPRGGTYIGMVAEHSDPYKPLGSYLTYVQDMGQDDLYYPANSMIEADNVITLVGWTIYDMNSVDFDQVHKVLDNLNKYNKPMLIRFANEMNESALGNDPGLYVSVFRDFANMVHEYPNFGVVWSPIDIGALDRPFEMYYPGDEYVDWIGVSCYTIRNFMGKLDGQSDDYIYFMAGDYGWATNRLKPFMEFVEKNNIQKPIMISEGGVATANKLGQDFTNWTPPRLRNMLYSLIMKYPQIKMINYFNVERDENEMFNLHNHPYEESIFDEAASCGAYIREYNGSPRFVFQKANEGKTIAIRPDGTVPLYTLAYAPKQPDLSVTYDIDGAWCHSANQIPYSGNFNMAGLSDGKHTMKISAAGNSKSYTFYKKGGYIRFGSEPDVPESSGNNNTPGIPADNGIKVILDGTAMSFDQPPMLINDRTMVPMRAIFEALGATVEWVGETNTINALRGDTRITMQIDNPDMSINGTSLILDQPPTLVNDRTLVPVRAVSESLGCEVSWEDSTQTVYITGK